MGAAVPVVQAAGRPMSQRIARVFDRWLLPIYAVMAVLYLMLPVSVMIIFSFNNPAGKFNFVWREFSLAAWQAPLAPPGLAACRAQQPHRGVPGHDLRDDPRDAHRARPGPPSVPRPGRHEPAHLPADVDAGDRPRLVAPDPVHRDEPVRLRPRRNLLPTGSPYGPDRPHHVQHQLRGRDREGTGRGLPAEPRGGRARPVCERVDGLLEGDLPAHPARASWPPPCSRSACRSTTSSSPTSPPGRPPPSPSGSTAPRRPACRCRPT